MEQVKALGIHVGISQACRCLGFARSSVYRWLKPTQSRQCEISGGPPRHGLFAQPSVNKCWTL